MEIINIVENFDKLNYNLIAYVISFLDHRNVIECCLISKRFRKALNSEFLWETLIMQNELFVQADKYSVKSWQNLYFLLNRLKSNMIGGKASIGFKMNSMRGHKAVVTGMMIYEKSSLEHILISGDKDGVVLYWIKDAEDNYEGRNLIKSDTEIIDMKLIKINEENNYYEEYVKLNENDRCLFIVTSKSFIYVFKISEEFSYELISTIKLENISIYQVEVYRNLIFYGTDFHIAGESKIIECRNIFTREIINEYKPQCNYFEIKKISEEFLSFDRSISQIKNYITLSKYSNPRQSFLIREDKICFLNNFDLINKISINHYKSVELPNFFISKINHKYSYINLKIDSDYLIELKIIQDFVIIFGMKYSSQEFTLNFYSFKENKIKFTKILKMNKISSININLNSFYSSFILNDNNLCVLFNQENFYDFVVKGDNVTQQIYKNYFQGIGEINYVSCDAFKFSLACDDNTIKIYSSKNKKLWYTLLSGSLTVMPKSFIPDLNVKGFSKVLLTKTAIIGCIGNLLRQYDFLKKY